MRIVLRESTNTCKSVKLTTLLVAEYGSKLCDTQWKIFVRTWFVSVFRYEKSGELHGLTRVRTFTQDDAHIFVRPDQVKAEFENNIDIILKVFKTFGFDNYEAQISLRDPEDKEKYIGSDEVWEESEAAIKEACAEKGLNARVELGEAAFYGPKLDFMVKDAIGRRWQLGTIQVDYNLPNRFKLEYTAEDNSKKTPVMVHRAPFGSLERFTAVPMKPFTLSAAPVSMPKPSNRPIAST